MSTLTSTGCGGGPSVRSATTETAAEALEWFRTLDARYEAFRQPIAAFRWRQLGGPDEGAAPNFAEAKKAEANFLNDAELDLRLAALEKHKAPAIAALARAWRQLRQRYGVLDAPSVRALQTRLDHALAGPPGSVSADRGERWLSAGADAKGRTDALRAIAKRTAAALPLLIERARRLDTIARNRGTRDYPDLATGLPLKGALSGIEQQCSLNLGQTQAAWRALMTRGAAKLGRQPHEGDFQSLTESWLGETSSWMTQQAVHEALGNTLTTWGLMRGPLPSAVEAQGQGPEGARVVAVAAPNDVRIIGRFPDGYLGARAWARGMARVVYARTIDQQHQPYRQLPHSEALVEGFSNLVASLLRDPQWLRQAFPTVDPGLIQGHLDAVAAYEAWSLRQTCLLARLELEAHTDRDLVTRHRQIFDESFGQLPMAPPAWLSPALMRQPLAAWSQVVGRHVGDVLLSRVGDRPMADADVGRWLRLGLLSKGNRLTLTQVLDPKVSPTLQQWLTIQSTTGS
ncbi:MAG: hypothetical protein ACE366_28735 [Bradymonadia bacterium]